MNALIATLNYIAPLINTLLVLSGLVGAIFVFRNAKKNGIILIQDQTITALNQRLDAQENEIKALKDKNLYLEQVIETISTAMKKKGVVISVDGELVTFTDSGGKSSTVRRQKQAPSTPSLQKNIQDDVKGNS